MARPRKSPEIKRLAGTERKHRQKPKTAAQALLKTPRPPKDLDEAAAEEWRKLAPVVTQLGTISQADLRAFELLCATLATVKAAEEVISKEGMTLETGSGGGKAHPAIKVMEIGRSQAAQLLRDFGLTPKSRSYVSRAPGGESKFSKFKGLIQNDFAEF